MEFISNLIKKPYDLLFDKSVSIFKKIWMIIVIISILLLIDNIFWFSFYYNNSNKISNISQIIELKINSSTWFTLSNETFNKLNLLEKEIINRENIFYNLKTIFNAWINKDINISSFLISLFEYFKTIDYINFIFINIIWIILLFFMTPQMFRKSIWEALAFILVMLLFMYLWTKFFHFLQWFFWYYSYFNLIINILFFTIIWILWNRKKDTK